MRSTRSIEVLCLALAALVLIWMHSFVSDGRAVTAVLLLYTALIALLWFRPLFPSRPRLRLAVVSWLMLAFVIAVLALSGKAYSPLFNLVLLPLILSALTLGWRMTLIQFLAIAVCHVCLALATPGHSGADPVAAERQLSELLARPETLLPSERMLAMVELKQVEQQLVLLAEAKRLRNETVHDNHDDKLATANRRLAAEIDENARLRKSLDEARAKLEAVTHIERSINDRGSSVPTNP